MTPANLKLFRRHESTCSGNGRKPYQKEFRIYEGDTEKRKGKPAVVDCSCSIYAEGTLYRKGVKVYLRPKNTGKRTWEEAKEIRERWLEWGGTEPPAQYQNPADELVPVATAVSRFMAVKTNQGIGGERLRDIERLLELRLVPFAEAHGITFIQQMDNAQVWADFRDSWTNLNPLHNKKPKAGESIPSAPLGKNTAAKHVGTLREFLRFCLSRDWLSDNWASKEHGLKATKTVDPKEPFSPQELEYIYRAIELKSDGHGYKVKRTGQQNAREILVFMWVLRYTGLRISDAVRLETQQLVPFKAYGYTHALWCHPMKTKDRRAVNFVNIPIQSENLTGHPNLVRALETLPVKQGRYFFWGGEGKLRTNISSWRARVNDIFKLAETLMEKDGLPERNGTHFSERPHPHKFRHTFAATLLQQGVPLRIVAQYLGDTETTVRKHYAKFCVAEQMEAAAVLADAMRKMVEGEKGSGKSRLQLAR